MRDNWSRACWNKTGGRSWADMKTMTADDTSPARVRY
jgi:hypothetical protein